jgi:AcrR family transcriptional regulator
MGAIFVNRRLAPSGQGAVVPEDAARDPLQELHPTAKAILVAARTVLRERGMAGLTLEAVANEANTSRTQVPYHFGSRAGLIEALFDWLFYEVWMRFMRPPGEARPMTIHESLEWSRQELADLSAVRDAWDLVVHSLRDEMARKRLVLLYARDRRLEVETLGLGPGAPEGAPDPEADRRRDAIGAVLLAIDEGLALQRAIDPDFDLDAALEAAEQILAHGLPEPRGETDDG